MNLDLTLKCPHCNSEQYFYKKVSYPTTPPKFEHICFDCGKISCSTNYNTFNKLDLVKCMTNEQIETELTELFKLNIKISDVPEIVTQDWIKVLNIVDNDIDTKNITKDNLFDNLDKLYKREQIVLDVVRYQSHSPNYAGMLYSLRRHFCV